MADSAKPGPLASMRRAIVAALDELDARLEELDAEIERTRAELREMTPQAKLYFKYVRCGKPNCRCNEGQKHGPYAYASYRDDDGRVRTVYWGKEPKLPADYIPQSVHRKFERRLMRLRKEREALLDRAEEALRQLRS